MFALRTTTSSTSTIMFALRTTTSSTSTIMFALILKRLLIQFSLFVVARIYRNGW